MTKYLYLPILIVNNSGLIVLFIFIGVAVVASLVLTIYFIALRKKEKLPTAKGLNKGKTAAMWFAAVGGKDNVVTIQGVGSRLNFLLKDQRQICREDLEQLGAKSVVLMANKVIVVVENQAEKIAACLNQLL